MIKLLRVRRRHQRARPFYLCGAWKGNSLIAKPKDGNFETSAAATQRLKWKFNFAFHACPAREINGAVSRFCDFPIHQARDLLQINEPLVRKKFILSQYDKTCFFFYKFLDLVSGENISQIKTLRNLSSATTLLASGTILTSQKIQVSEPTVFDHDWNVRLSSDWNRIA